MSTSPRGEAFLIAASSSATSGDQAPRVPAHREAGRVPEAIRYFSFLPHEFYDEKV